MTAASGREVMPSWSHDGTRVAFAGDRAGNWDVYVTEAGGGTPFPVAAGPSDETLPSWSPVADRIAFVRTAAPQAVEANLWTVSSSGGDERPVGPDAHAFSRAAWAPDGRALAYAAGHECQRWGIYVAAADGGGARRITNHCRFTGTPAADVLRGTDFLDFLDGLGGDDRLYGGGSRDQISGGAGNDLLDGDGGYDTLLGGPGADVLIGRGDPDVIVPGPGADRVFAGPSRDSVDARDGARDVVDCGTGWGVDRVAADRVDVVRNCEIVRRA